MFETELADKFKRIFGVKKVTYDLPGESEEQECIFIEVERSRNQIKTGLQADRAKAIVRGKAFLFGNNEKIPFGFFDKRIQQASHDDTKDLFFHDVEVNTRRYLNKVQRGFSFVYLFDGQYDPDNGEITSVEFSEGET